MQRSRLTFLTCSLVVSSCIVYCHGYQSYQRRIPNGDKVPHPCKNETWPGVGHDDQNGAGVRNPFGTAFATANNNWTTDLCKADSDGDGKTNGEELGDPTCIWTAGNPPPPRTKPLSHPGVCEPTDSEACTAKNTWDFGCPKYKKKDNNSAGMKEVRSPLLVISVMMLYALYKV